MEENKTVLLVDDVKEFLNSTKAMLELEDFNVITETNPEKALDLLKRGEIKPDILITDYDMIEMKGDEFIIAIREFNKKIPIILATRICK